MKRNPDLWLALVLLAFCAFAAAITFDLSDVGTGTWAGPSFFPWLMIGGIALLSVVLVLRSLGRPRLPANPKASIDKTIPLKIALFFVMMVAYAVFYVSAGYIVSSIVFFIIAMLVLGERKFLHFAVVPIGIIVSVYLVFTQAIKVYLP